ncbi:histidine phosphatase family protein [Conyzicola nivalis]|uniref:phosphoglycerate mutase (2,3-diphosphoglycerate-dependent) n=1 Tax=Conyzicola nivalis TaxID=1477021 RepID=A0A916WHW6_9MICO|nr:histidine phosphatase family protein [Conyzicola nivalis]GGA99145.1 phosphoglycerate mutase [Conyzicola nivalis]
MAAHELWLIRHGESLANRAATAAENAGLEVVSIDLRDADVPLSPTGEEQAEALGAWLADLAEDERPDAAWSSSYLRARQTVSIALTTAGSDVVVRVDERLRDRELGVLDLLTTHGVETRFPEEALRKRWLGKFYYRPPGGESWADLALRIRSLLVDLERPETPSRVLIAGHDAIVMIFIYVCLGLSESELLEFAQTHTVANASVTRLVRDGDTGEWTLEAFSLDEHLVAAGAPVTLHGGDDVVQPR